MIRKELPFIGYGSIRQVLLMSAGVKAWVGSTCDVPKLATGADITVVRSLVNEEVDRFIDFM